MKLLSMNCPLIWKKAIVIHCFRVSDKLYTKRQYLPSATKLRSLCFYTSLWFCSRGGGGVLSQHALQVVSQHALQQGGSAPRGVPALGGGVPVPGGVCSWGVPALGGVCSWGGACSGGCLLWGVPARGVWRPPTSRWLLVRTVRILLECILVI